MVFPRIPFPVGAVLLLLSPVQLWAQILLVDDLHRTVTLTAPARRVVSLAPSVTETLFAIGAADQVVGVTDYCNYPPEARRKTHVGGMINPSIEALLGLNPDLVVLSMEGNMREDFRRLTSLGVPLFITNPRTLGGIYRSIEQLGMLTGRADSAHRLVQQLAARERAARSRAPQSPVRSLFVVSVEPLIVAGRNTFMHELLTAAGGTNLAASTRGTYPTYSRETLVANDPDVIFITSDAIASTASIDAMFPEWRITSALRHKRVYLVDADMMTRPGPRALDALEELVHLLTTPP
jgi:iron complex transport system substrate-binding protein